MSDSLESEKQFYDSLGQFYEDLTEEDGELYPIQNLLNSSGPRFNSETFFASGGIKKVFTILENSTERKIALARPHESNSKVAESFLREARRTALLEHANIVRIYDVGIDEQGPWFTMEFIDGDSLQQKISRLSLTDEWDLYERLEVFSKVCDAIAFAHSKGILHLDIKPDNIRMGEFGKTLVCDWGLSFLDYSLDSNAELSNDQTIHGIVKGTPGYMSPEQIKGEKSVQSDIFSLGALLYTLLNYKAPIAGGNTEEVLKNTLAGNFLLNESDNTPQRLRPVIRKALAVNLEDRYKSVSEFQEEIHKYRAGFATNAENPSLITQLHLFYARNKSLSLIVCGFLGLIIFLTCRHIQVMEEKQQELMSEKEKAEEAFELYKTEEKARNIILDQFSNSLIVQSRFDLDSFNVERSLINLKKALEKDPKNQETIMQIGFVYFIQNNFKLASEFFSKTSFGKVEDLKGIAKKYQSNDGLLSAVKLIEVFKQVTRNNLLMYMYTYYVKNQLNHDEVVTVTKYLIQRRNKLRNLKFDYKSEQKSLSLSNNSKLSKLYSISSQSIKDFCLLRYLNLSHLDVSHTSFESLEDLNYLKLLTLNLKETSIQSIEYLKTMPSLRKVTLGEKQRDLVKSDYHFVIVFE